jgi:DMSO/TMAO reductase YedYZ heme-binding membrane subunit
MKFRGLDPRTRWIRWGLLAIALGIVLGATGPAAVGTISRAAALEHDKLPWYASRLLAFLSYFAVAASVVYGLLLSTKLLDAIAHRPISFALHQDLAAFGLGLAGVHGMLLALDKTVPQTLAQIAIPFAGPYRPLWVGAGQVSFWLMAVVVGSFYVRRRIGQRAWRLLHYTTFLAFVGATAHGLLSGTDSGQAWAWWSYVVPTIAVVFLFVYRVVASVSERRSPAGRPRPLPALAVMGRPLAPGRPVEPVLRREPTG